MKEPITSVDTKRKLLKPVNKLHVTSELIHWTELALFRALVFVASDIDLHFFHSLHLRDITAANIVCTRNRPFRVICGITLNARAANSVSTTQDNTQFRHQLDLNWLTWGIFFYAKEGGGAIIEICVHEFRMLGKRPRHVCRSCYDFYLNWIT